MPRSVTGECRNRKVVQALGTTLSCFDMVVSEICLGQDRNTQPEHDLKLLLHHLHLELPPQPPPRITAPAPSPKVRLAPDNDEIARLTATLTQRMTRLLDRRGLGPDSDAEESDSLPRDEPWLAGLYAAAVTGRTAYGPNAGRRVTRVGDQIDPESMDLTLSPRCATSKR